MPAPLSDMLAALAEEIALPRRNGGGRGVPPRGGARAGVDGGHDLYRLPLPEGIPIRDDIPVRVTAGGRQAAGHVASVRPGLLAAALEADLGAHTAPLPVRGTPPGSPHRPPGSVPSGAGAGPSAPPPRNNCVMAG